MMTQYCQNCQFNFDNTCRRYPRQVTLWPTDNQHPITYDVISTWPDAIDDEWCGEWAARKPVEPYQPEEKPPIAV